MSKIISVLVENKAGVLSRVSSLFARRRFNIESLAVGETEDHDISRMTIVIKNDDETAEQVEKQLNKVIDVIKVRQMDEQDSIVRELVLVKVKVDVKQRSQVIDIVRVLEAKIIDISTNTLTVEYCSTTERINQLIELLRPYNIKQVARTGAVALEKGGC
jgi:acetolactate synthase-1/3 small subunit